MSGNILVSRAFETPAVDVSTATIDPTRGAFAVANNLRIASLSIATYECVTSYVSSSPILTNLRARYLITLPAEIRLYKSSNRRR